MNRLVLGALGLAFVVALILATLRETRVDCELCVRFEGREACRRASGADRNQAMAMAQSTACAVLTGGVTRGMQCNRVLPHSVRCEGDASRP
jgi:hypothetical protein